MIFTESPKKIQVMFTPFRDGLQSSFGGEVNPLMAAMGPNVAGVIGSAVAAGVFLALLG